MSITYETTGPQRREIRLAGWRIGLPLRLRIMCRGSWNPRHASTNNKLCPTRGWRTSRIGGSIVGVGVVGNDGSPRQTSCVVGGDAERLRLCKNPSAQVSAESIMDARAITINSQP